ncbi:putative mucin TcMUCII [Trypanosoma cruzi]|uniref:Mucin TcMUCII, putative n=2 Tax=Trypanosoma cruzi TaxID=5693 RepID=Q4E464_TRYCC|nr:mucin TcMUCII, putative [Trypanosoma cruzi]EAN99559.1 mucin TcMUCII, putative [Trypanosoma cruzi]PWV21275.1 putative mucin TcMUCII [Trypanosoma cruzi]|eukprot:XP_821410.1 mucin TcMUCII [Trypanosoma cruzi strain CL Brener]
MMTCRLLCALLVLALCCCPSVCTSESPKMDDASSATTNTITQTPTANKSGGADESVKSHSSTSLESGLQEKDHSVSSVLGPVADSGTKAGADPGGATPEKQSNGPNNVVHTEVKRSTTESQSGTSVSLENEDNEAEDAPTTNTTTTKVPITSTTAPVAPSTTTTEAPTTTTTRAPSLLREDDGSLSSSAWVCAPLLLAASAVAYTTVG